MNDDQLGREIVAALLKDDPGEPPARLSSRVAAVPDETARHRAAGSVRRSPISGMLQTLEAIAAVIVVGALIVAALVIRGSSAGPVSGSSRSAGTTATPSGLLPTESGAPQRSEVPAPTTSAPADHTTNWTGLNWSAPSVIPSAESVDDIVFYNGRYIAAGRLGTTNSSGGQLPVGIWTSADGSAWTQVGLGATMFYNANIAGVVATDTDGLVAWGTAGDPVCTGQGEGMTCGPLPVMIWTSPDGTRWSRVADLATFTGATIGNVSFGPLGLVAVGDTGFNNPGIWVSQSGTSWERQRLDPAVFKDAHLSWINATDTGYVIGGSTGGKAPTSGGVELPSTGVAAAWWFDGQTWHKATVNRTHGAGTNLNLIYVGAGGMVAIGSESGGNGGAAWNSSDGKIWQPLVGAPSPSTLPSAIVGSDGTRLVAVGDGNDGKLAIWGSVDGATWTALPFSGATGTIPSGPGAVPGIPYAYIVPDGLIVVVAPGQTESDTSVWHVAAR